MDSFSRQDVETIKQSGLFDEAWYLETYRDVAITGMDPVEHYLWIGAKLARDPSAGFSTAGYLKKYGDVRRSGANALLHFIRYGRAENRQPKG